MLGPLALVGAVALVVASPAMGRPFDEADRERGRFVAMGGVFPLGSQDFACFRCHGIDGEGNYAGAVPRLAGQSAFYLYKQLIDYASGARPSPVMQPIAEALSDEDRENVAAYYAGLTEVPYPPLAVLRTPEPDMIARGAHISEHGLPERNVQACRNCHGPSGRGIPPSFPYLAGQDAAYLENELQAWKRGRRNNDPLNGMWYYAVRLSDADIRALAAFFASIRPEVQTGEAGQ